MTNDKRLVAILLCTYNGAQFLQPQLDSFLRQNHKNWELWVSDDGSTDATLDMLYNFKKENPYRRIEIIDGPKNGFSANFLSLTENSKIVADYYSWSDQDDIWLPHKLERAVNALDSLKDDQGAFYFARSILVDSNDQDIMISRIPKRPTSFANALVQNIASGNTIVFNNRIRNMLISTPHHDIPYHDWWIYLLATACDFSIIFDQEATIRYRQHQNNVVGASYSLTHSFRSFYSTFFNVYKKVLDKNLSALDNLAGYMNFNNNSTYKLFCSARESNVISRMQKLHKSGVYRTEILGIFKLYITALLGKI